MTKALSELFLLEYPRNVAIPIQYLIGSICLVVLLDEKNTSIKFTLPAVAIRSKAADLKIPTEL